MRQLTRVSQREKLPNPDNFFVVIIQPTEWYALVLRCGTQPSHPKRITARLDDSVKSVSDPDVSGREAYVRNREDVTHRGTVPNVVSARESVSVKLHLDG